MSGQIVQRNLKRKLTKRNIPPTSIADYVTIEDIGNRVLEVDSDNPIIEVDADFRQRAEAAVLSEAEEGEYSDQLGTFATQTAWHDDETLEELDAELSDYLRATDSGGEHDAIVELANESENHFVREEMATRLQVFDEFIDILSNRVGVDWADLYLTRSHLVTAAKEAIEDNWIDAYGVREWFAISTLNVLDNTTLQLILAIAHHDDAPDVHFFFQFGTYERQVGRLEAILGEDNVETPDDNTEPSEFMDGRAAETLSAAVRGEDYQVPETIYFTEAPERRREVEHVVESIRDQLSQGVDPDDIIVISRDVGTYQSIVEDIFETNEIPYHVESPRPYAHVPAYRFLKATVDLLSNASRGQPLDYHQLTDPLRLGFCYPNRWTSVWPVSDRIFLYLEQRLHNHQQRNEDEDIYLQDWLDVVDDREGWEFAWDLMGEYLEWINDRIDQPPEEGIELRGFIRDLLRSYIRQRIPDRRGIPGGPGIDPTRTNLGHSHPSSTGQRVLNQADDVGQHYDFATNILDNPPTWYEVSRAIGEVIGTGTYGVSNNDGQAIRVVDAGNTHFLDASQTYILGFASGEFPVDPDSPSFIHDEFRNEVTRLSAEGIVPNMHFDSRVSQYEVDLDIYETTLRASGGSITALHRYKDADRNRVNWSPFVDLLPTDDLGVQVRADQWLPEPESHQRWADTANRISSKDRIRLLYHHAHRPHPERQPEISPGDITDIATATDSDSVINSIFPRYDRYARPPTSIEVSADEPAFGANNLELPEVVGSPARTHEIDLLSHCQLKYHFYQLIFNYQGEDVQRDEIPFYRSGEPDYRLGDLPNVIRHNYVEDRYADHWRDIIQELLPNRQSDLQQFDTRAELEEWFESNDLFTGWDEISLLPVLVDEWELVQAELDVGIEREWHWQETRDLQISDEVDVDIRQPSHRRDVFPDEYELPIFFARNTSYGRKAVKRCWNYDGEHRRQTSHAICRSCGQYEDCSYPTKFVLDHRFHSVAAEGSDVVGIQYQARFDSGERRGHLKENHLNEVRSGLSGDPEDDFGDDSFEAWLWHEHWIDQLTEDAETYLSTLEDGTSVRFEIDEQFVDDGGCDSCVYRDMCMVPQSRGAEW